MTTLIADYSPEQLARFREGLAALEDEGLRLISANEQFETRFREEAQAELDRRRLIFDTRHAAAEHLDALGLTYAYHAPHDDGFREYWAYDDGTDALLDHSATITPIGERFHISLFDRKPQLAPEQAEEPADYPDEVHEDLADVDPAAPREVVILAHRLGEARAKLDKLVRKAQRYGNTDVRYTVGEIFHTTEKRVDPFTGKVKEVPGPDKVILTVEGAAPRVGDFEFLAKVDHGAEGNILDIVPGETVHPRFRDTSSVCEHCNTKRTRNETFVVRNRETGAEVQVGRNCLADYIGTNTPAGLVQCFAFLRELKEFNDEWGGGRWVEVFEVHEVLAATTVAIRLFGWCSRGQAMAQEGNDLIATASIVAGFLSPPRTREHNEDIFKRNEQIKAAAQVPGDLDYAAQIVEWLAAQPRDTANDYMYNLKTAVGRGMIEGKRLGIVCSAVQAYERAMEREVRRTREIEERKVSQYVGTEGERLRNLPVTFVEARFLKETQFGPLVKNVFRDEASNLLVWITGQGCGLNPGERAILTGSVKRHSEYKGVKETGLSRCILKEA